MTARNTRRFRSTLEQRIVGGELARLFLQHHGHGVADRIGETIHAADQHLRLALELERPLAHRTGEYLEQACIHQICPPATWVGRTFASTRASNSCASRAPNCAATGTYHSRGLANASHFTASFSVMSTGKSSVNASSGAAKR